MVISTALPLRCLSRGPWRRVASASSVAWHRSGTLDGQRRHNASHFAPKQGEAQQLEASSACVAAVVAAAGLAGGLALLAFKPASDRGGATAAPVESISPGDFVCLGRSSLAARYSYQGAKAAWLGKTLRLRHDDDGQSRQDAAATRTLGGQFAPASELVSLDAAELANLDAAAVKALGGSSSGRSHVLALRVADIPTGAQGLPVEGSVLTLELKPGCGLEELYGDPARYRVQEESVLRQEERAKKGAYYPHDLYSRRPERVSRALIALSETPGDRLRVYVDGKPEDIGSATLPEVLSSLGLAGLDAAMELMALLLHGDGAPLLAALLRAQCGSAGDALETAALQLRGVQRRHSQIVGEEVLSPEAELEEMFERGFWTLPPDESGMHLRKREAERLLERAARGLWTEGSASSSELKRQIRKFLCLYRLGVAATQARLLLSLARPGPGAAAQDALRQQQFAPVGPAAPGIWCRLTLMSLELPSSAA